MVNGFLTTPVALFVFNRPKKTAKVVEQIAASEPPTLLVVSDGPRDTHPDDVEKVAETRSVVEDSIDWKCDLRRNYADENLGVKDRFVTGLRWVFSEVSEAIILEDDCVPSTSFFPFCETMLEVYRDDERIMDITGRNQLGVWKDGEQDYHFSNYGGIWGWATWRRAWEWYDPDMTLWEDTEVRDRMRDVIADDKQSRYLKYIYQKAADGRTETWDYQWGFSRHINSALSIVPSKNLVSNIGFDEEATHTDSDSKFSDTPRYELDFPIERNEFVAVDREYDRQFHKLRPVSHRYRTLRQGRRLYSLLREQLF